MVTRRIRELFRGLEDTHEFVLARQRDSTTDIVVAAWCEAAARAREAYEEWRTQGDGEAYARYVAFADQEYAAQDALAAHRGGF